MLTLFRRRQADVQADWYRQAHCLRRLGYHSAAVFSMRAAIERQLVRLAMLHPEFSHSTREHKKSIDALVLWLSNRGMLAKDHKRAFQKFAERANKAAHGVVLDKSQSLCLLRQAKSLRRCIDAAMRVALAS